MSLKKNVIANYLGNGWAAIMGLAFIPMYIKYLGMEAYGLIGFYAMLQACLGLVDAGMTPTLSREMSRFTGGAHSSQSIRDLLRSLEIIALAITSTYALTVWLSARWLATSWLKVENLPIETVVQAFSIMGLVTAMRFMEGLYRGAIIGLQKQVLFNLVNAGIATLRSLGAVLILAYYSPTIYVYFIWQAVVSFTAVLVFSTITYRNLLPAKRTGKFSKTELVKVWRFAAGIFATTLLVLLLTQIDKMLLSKLLSLEAFGQYNLAATVANSLLILVGPITQAHYPKLTEMQSSGDFEQTRKIFHRGSQLVSVIVGTASCLIFCFGERLIVIWTGNEELGSNIAYLLKIMTLGTMFNGFMTMPYMLQLAHGWSSFAAKVNLIAVILLVPAILLVIPIFGPIGAAWVWVILNASYVFIASHFMFKVIFTKEKSKWFVDDLLKPFAAAAAVIVLFWTLKPVSSHVSFDIVFFAAAGGCATLVSAIASNELRPFIPGFKIRLA
ncbi:MAG: oligosaccharide flippase family protein [Candidatus Riflebacteria bacterium]|nr:oligosaccharide flippase family protein [Candidatus Riflebacteria bacterium]